MKGFTGIRDVDKEILLRSEDNEIVEKCVLNSYFASLCDESFYRNKLVRSFPKLFETLSKVEIESFKDIFRNKLVRSFPLSKVETKSFKDIYLMNVYYVNKLKEDYNFIYKDSIISPKEIYDEIKFFNDYYEQHPLILRSLEEAKSIYEQTGDISLLSYMVKSLPQKYFMINKGLYSIYKFYKNEPLNRKDTK